MCASLSTIALCSAIPRSRPRSPLAARVAMFGCVRMRLRAMQGTAVMMVRGPAIPINNPRRGDGRRNKGGEARGRGRIASIGLPCWLLPDLTLLGRRLSPVVWAFISIEPTELTAVYQHSQQVFQCGATSKFGLGAVP